MSDAIKYAVELTGEELCYILAALQERRDTWYRTADYLESGGNDPNNDGPIEDVDDLEVARRVAESYQHTLDKIAAIPVELRTV